MGIYADLGVRPIINAAGTLTRVGGSRMAPEVLAAMAEAADSFVHIDELQARAGEIIAEVTGAEAGYVVTGAAAGLTLGVAACVAGLDVAAMDRLPDTTGLRREVVVQRGHRNAYDHAIRAVGVTFVEAGYLGYPGAGGTAAWQVEAAITERTCAIACPILPTPGTLSLPEIVAIARKHDLPVVVDAAAELPPRANLRRFIAEGADLVAFSGGKAIGGPQASGILAGRRDLITSVALQHQDMDVRPETWNQRGLLARQAIAGVPHQGFGRGMKVGREEIVGLITALRRFVAGDDDADFARWSEEIAYLADGLRGMPHLTITREVPATKPLPMLTLSLDQAALGFTAFDAVNALLTGEPGIAVGQSRAEFGELTIVPQGLREAELEILGARLRAVLAPW